MNIALWISQGLLAVAYMVTGLMKATQHIDSLGKSMCWVRDVPTGFVRFIGVGDLLGAVGLILPFLTGVAPWLTVAAAVGLIIVQIGATTFHASRRKFAGVPVNLVRLILALFVAYGRLAIVQV